jgi:hypothetical protein
LPGLDQLLSHIIASTEAAEAAAAEHQAQEATVTLPLPGTQQHVQLLWQDLLQLLFVSAPAAVAASPQDPQLAIAPQHNVQASNTQQQQQQPTLSLVLPHAILTPDDVMDAGDDLSLSEESWDDADEGWLEVDQQDDLAQQQQEGQQQPPGQLLAAAIDPLYVVSAKTCRKAAVCALRAYLQVRKNILPGHCIHMLCKSVAEGCQWCSEGVMQDCWFDPSVSSADYLDLSAATCPRTQQADPE